MRAELPMLSIGRAVRSAAGWAPLAAPAPSAAAGPGLDAATAVAAADLLAHWWSRPVADEVSSWPGAAGIEADVRSRIYGEPEAARSRLSPGPGQQLALEDEYERLFVGPGQVSCPPYESCWREDVPIDIWGSLMGPCTAEVRRLYSDLGLEVALASGELPDHVAIELEALAYALAVAETRPIARALFTDHLGMWLPRLCGAVAQNSTQPFYRHLAAVTVDWLGHIRRYLGLAAGADARPPR